MLRKKYREICLFVKYTWLNIFHILHTHMCDYLTKLNEKKNCEYYITTFHIYIVTIILQYLQVLYNTKLVLMHIGLIYKKFKVKIIYY